MIVLYPSLRRKGIEHFLVVYVLDFILAMCLKSENKPENKINKSENKINLNGLLLPFP